MMVLLFLVCLSVLPFSIPYLPSNTTVEKFLGKALRALVETGMALMSINNTLIWSWVLAIQAVNPSISGREVLDVKTDSINCSL